ncbi:MAG: DEAD/DEAH box helicase [Candidatus Thalassarchaeaceae archaeon]|nr:DEAD/DEAH box helicase [Candidatus Thalassarchaeaceae archaeon]
MDAASFLDLGIDKYLTRALSKQGIDTPFEVQIEAIPPAMKGKDVCCRAPTGSGKTLAFGLPLLARCRRAEAYLPTALILTPTRELAEQICTVLTPLANEINLEVLAIYGGTPYSKQRRALERGVDIIVACPGRLLDLFEHEALGLEDVDIVVLDEADRMADMGFMEPVCEILDACASERQTVLFSATLDDDVADLVSKYQQQPEVIEVGPKEVSMDSMQHFFWLMPNSKKAEIAAESVRKMGRSVIFCRTRAGVDRIGDELEDQGLQVTTIHGGLTQKQRDRAMRNFADGEYIALIATDVAARGIDIQGIQCVIHFDPPENGKAYKHRSGRTARAGTNGVVISLVQKPQKRSFSRIQRDVGIRVQFTPPDFTELPHSDFKYTGKPRKNRVNVANSHRRNDRQRRNDHQRNKSQYGRGRGRQRGPRDNEQRDGKSTSKKARRGERHKRQKQHPTAAKNTNNASRRVNRKKSAKRRVNSPTAKPSFKKYSKK